MDFDDIAGLINQVALEQIGRPLKDVERLVLKGAWYNQTYGSIAEQAVGYSEDYLKKDVGPKLWHLLSALVDTQNRGIKVTKRNLQNVLRTWAKQRQASQGNDGAAVLSGAGVAGEVSTVVQVVRSAPAVEVADFCGREEDLATLTQWLTGEGLADGPCRLVWLWGLPGLGKTALAGQILHRLGPTMDRCGYLDLTHHSTDEAVVSALATWLAPSEPPPTATPIDWLIDRLGRQRCLLVLDHLDLCFDPQHLAGQYQPGREAIQQLLHRWATEAHPGHVVVISRELPADRFQWLGPRAREYPLQPLTLADTQALLLRQGAIPAPADQWADLWQRYGGYPLLLRHLATTLRSLYQGQLSPLLAQPKPALPDSLRHSWQEVLQRLTPGEQALLYWLALAQSPMALEDLQSALPSYPGPAALQSLVSRSLCQTQALPPTASASPCTQLDLPPLLRTLVTDHLLDQLEAELLAGDFHWLQRLPLVTMTAQESVQATQRATLVNPLAQRLRQHFPQPTDLVQACHQQIRTLRQQHRGQPGFGAANWLHLCQALGVSVSGVDFSDLALWQADLRQVSLQGANLSQVDFRDTQFATALGRNPQVAFCPGSPAKGHAGRMVTGDQEGRLLVWEVTSGRLVQVMDEGEDRAVQSLAVSPDGDTLAVGSDGGEIWLWPMAAMARSDALSGHGAAVQAVAFSNDGAWLASGDRQGELRLWEVASGRCWACWREHRGAIHSLAFNGSGDRLISGGDDQTTCLWDLSEARLMTVFQAPATATIRAAGFLSDPNDPDLPAMPFAAGYDDPCLTLWDVQTGRPCWMRPADVRTLPALSLSPDGRYLACSCQDFSVVVWDIASRSRCYTLPPADSPVWLLAFSPDSRYLVTGSDYRLHLWQTGSGTELRRFLSQAHPVNHVAVGAGGSPILTGHSDHRLRLWCHQGGIAPSHPQSIGDLSSDPLQTIALSPDGQWCARASTDHTLALWHSATGQRQWVTHGPVHLIAFSPDSQHLASVGPDHTLALWAVESGQRLREWEGEGEGRQPRTPPSTLAFSPDGQSIISGSRDGTLAVWWLDAATSAPLLLTGHQRPVHAVALSADGQSLISASHDGTVRSWNLPQGRSLGLWSPPEGHWVHSVTFDASDTSLAITSHTTDVAVWEVSTNRLRHTLRGHSQPLWTALVSPNREHLVTASQDSEIRLWNLTLGSLQQSFHPDRPYAGVNIRGATGLSASEGAMLKSLGAIVSY